MSGSDTDPDQTDDLRRQLERTLMSAESVGKEIASKGHDIAAEGQSVADWADATRQAFAGNKNPIVLGNLIQGWLRVNESATQLNAQLSASRYLLVSSTTYVASAGLMLVLGQETPDRQTGEGTLRRLKDLASRPEVYKSVSALLKQFGLDTAQGNLISAYDQFETAHREYQVNAAAEKQATTWLIPMRECILTVIDRFFKQLPDQNKQKGSDNKVRTILIALSQPGVESDHVDNLATECKSILDQNLSPSKQTSMSRSQSETILLASTMWLKSFLSLIDSNKLRRPAR